MRYLRPWLAILVIHLLLLTACAASSAPGSAKPEPLVIRIFAQQDASQNLKTNGFSKLLEDRFNVRFDWLTVPYEGAKEKRQISLAGNRYADAYILTSYIDQFSQADVLRYGQQGLLYPLNDLIERDAPHIRDAFAQNAELRTLSTAPDGNIYGLVDYSECFHCSYPYKMWINAKWLDGLHLAMPSTTEAFRDVLRAFKTRDPNGNGKADEVSLSGSTEDFGVRIVPFLMNGFIYDDDRTYLRLTDGKAGLVADRPEWKEGLAYIKSLYDEGLIDPGAFTQNADAFKQIGENADAQILGAGAAMHPDIFVGTGADNRRGGDYRPVPPLKGPHADNSVYQGSGGISPGAKFVITNEASEAARIALIRMVDYMFTPEGQANAEVGLEGVDWRKPAPGEHALGPDAAPAFARIPAREGAPPSNQGWGGMGHFYMPKTYRDSWVQSMDIYSPDGYERRLYKATQLYEGHEPDDPYPFWSVWIDAAQADEADNLQTIIKGYIDQSALQFITGAKDLAKDWDEYVAGLKRIGADRYVATMQRAYDDRLARSTP
ncbi:extracellular solute-binding protein [Cohnella nanjingensis]|uniref:Extracellular solute-binding protein n=1 Tax=Cohnella nanjingensis TaxID=1387779 RepID=A0A7X0RW44_9BACL|nr:extracellular solute-binding protein [Cohnella nanjingensis]MBB6674690.1 extracellular solute-binding protein [Cohnella nanjingensis]